MLGVVSILLLRWCLKVAAEKLLKVVHHRFKLPKFPGLCEGLVGVVPTPATTSRQLPLVSLFQSQVLASVPVATAASAPF